MVLGRSSITADIDFTYCFARRKDGNCLPSPLQGIDAPDACTIIPSTNAESTDRNLWMSALNETVQSAIVQGLCTALPTLQECDCNQRSSREAFQLAASDPIVGSIPDACWWRPCKTDDLSTWGTTSDRATNGLCPTNLCLNIVDFENLDQIDNLNQYVSCAQSGSAPAAGSGPGESNTEASSLTWIVVGSVPGGM